MLLDAFLDNHSESPECLGWDMAKIYRCLKLFFNADKRDISIKNVALKMIEKMIELYYNECVYLEKRY